MIGKNPQKRVNKVLGTPSEVHYFRYASCRVILYYYITAHPLSFAPSSLRKAALPSSFPTAELKHTLLIITLIEAEDDSRTVTVHVLITGTTLVWLVPCNRLPCLPQTLGLQNLQFHVLNPSDITATDQVSPQTRIPYESGTFTWRWPQFLKTILVAVFCDQRLPRTLRPCLFNSC